MDKGKTQAGEYSLNCVLLVLGGVPCGDRDPELGSVLEALPKDP